MGKAFAFLNRELVAQDLPSLDSDRHHILCSLGKGAAIEGLALPVLPLPPRPNLRVVTCDKELYYENRDSIHLLIYDPMGADGECPLTLRQGRLVVRQLSPILGAFGQAEWTLDALPVGDYEVVAQGETLCSFKVAAYSLAPLVATLQDRVKEDDDFLQVTLRVESYGTPLEGGIWTTLRSGHGQQRRVFGMVKGGILRARLQLDGAGPYAIDLQHAEQTELTATVPLPGTRKSERVGVPISGLSPAWEASLLPTQRSHPIRELHVTSVVNEDSLFQLERVDTSRARLTARRPAAPVSVAVLDPCRQSEPRVLTWESVEIGQVLEFDLPSPLGVIAIGAFLDDEPWEGWAINLAPSGVTPELALPDSSPAGEPVTIEVRTSQESPVYLLVKDARLQNQDRPATRLASRLLQQIRDWKVKSRTGMVKLSRDSGFREGLGNVLQRWSAAGHMVTGEQLQQAERLARWTDRSAQEILASVLGLSLLEFRAKLSGFEIAELTELDPELARLIPEDLARRYRCLPTAQQGTNTILLAIADPCDIIALDDITLITGFNVVPVVADADEIARAINQQYGVTDLVEVEETVKDISAQDFGSFDLDEEIQLDRLRELDGYFVERPQLLSPEIDEVAEHPEISQAEVLFAGWLKPVDGLVTVEVPTPDQPAEFAVEVFAVGELDWASAEARFVTEKPLALYFELPPFVHPQDQVEGRLRIVRGLPPFRLTITCDGELLDVPEVAESCQPITFLCPPGRYRATVEEIATGRCEHASALVESAGRLSGLKCTVQWLGKGDRLCRNEDKTILGLAPLDGVKGPAERLGTATADYAHLCCEQTAAKILSACALWMTSTNGKRGRLESIIRAGVEREKSMFLPGRGLALYPGGTDPCDYWGSIAARYLCQLELMRRHPKEPDFSDIIEQGIEIGHQAAKAHGVNWPPTERRTADECYLEMRFGESDGRELVAKALRGFPDEGWGRVGERIRGSYRSAILLRGREHLPVALELANEVFQDIGASGGLYSTADSIACMALLDEVGSFLSAGQGAAKLEGDPDGPQSIEVTEGNVLVEVTRTFLEDWSELTSSTSLQVDLPERAVAGQRVSMTIGIPDGYQNGDLVWVCLPKGLAQLSGGGQVRRFSVDFEGKSRITIELVALAPTLPEGETLLVCLRNMFIEERVALAEPLRVQIEAPTVSKMVGLEIGDSLYRVDLTRNGLRGTPQTLEQMQTLSGEIHNPELMDLIERIVDKAIESDASHVMFDWVDEGVARCRFKTASGVEDVMRYPAPLQALIVGRLQMLSRHPLGSGGPQEGTVRLRDYDWPVTILPTNVGMMATLQLVQEPTDQLGWMRALSRVQQALSEDCPVDLEALLRVRPQGPDPAVDELLEVLGTSPVAKARALGLLARLAAGAAPERREALDDPVRGVRAGGTGADPKRR
jgi:MshEN domain